jgi:hypothetical protein
VRVLESKNPVGAQDELLEEKTMWKEHTARRSSGARTIAIDERELLLRHRLIQLLAVLLAAATALGIYQIFIH